MSGDTGRAGVRECLVASAPAALTARAIRGVDLGRGQTAEMDDGTKLIACISGSGSLDQPRTARRYTPRKQPRLPWMLAWLSL